MSIADSTLPVLDSGVWRGIAAMFANGDPLELAELVAEFECASTENIKAIGESCAAGARIPVERTAHAWKSSSGYLGAVQLEAFCATVENLARAGDLAAVADMLPAFAECSAQAVAALRRKIP